MTMERSGSGEPKGVQVKTITGHLPTFWIHTS